MANSAVLRRKGKAQSCTFYTWFRHPVLGKAVERSLKTSDEKHAAILTECLNLILADPAWHRRIRPGTPLEIVSTFYDPIKSQLIGIQHFEDPPKDIVVAADGTISNWDVSPSKQAAADQMIIDESFDALRWRQRYQKLKRLYLKKKRIIEALTRRLGESERRLTGKGTPTLENAVELFNKIQRTKVAATTYGTRSRRVQRFVSSLGGERTVGSVKASEIDEHIAAIVDKDGDTVSAMTRKNTRIDIGVFMNWSAKKWGFTSPMYHTERISAQAEGDVVYLTQAEVNTLLGTCVDTYWRAVIATLIYSGIRASELRWLQVDDVDIEGGVIQVRTVVTENETKVPKTGKRAIRFHEDLRPYLKAYIDAGHPGTRFYFPKQGYERERFKHGGEPDVWRAQSFSHVLTPLLKPIAKSIGKPINALVMRHTFGSLMIRNGFNYIEVSAIMGNSPDICRRHYARLSPDEIRASWPTATT